MKPVQQQSQSTQRTKPRTMAVHAADALPAAAPIANPLHAWRGFFVASFYWFGYYFFGYRLTPACAAARTMLD
jgi:hypothetical protein